MAYQDVVPPALLLPLPVLSLALSLFNCLSHRSASTKSALLLLIAILAAVAGGTALSVACGQPLAIVAKVFITLLQTTMSGISVYALSQTSPFPAPFLKFFLSPASLLIACELVSTLIPSSPPLLPATLALVSRGILLTLAIATAILLRRRAVASKMGIEKGRSTDQPAERCPARVSSPTPATWPFPGSLALQKQLENGSSPPDTLIASHIPRPSLTCDVERDACMVGRHNLIFLAFLVMIAQIFAGLSAAVNVTTSILLGGELMDGGGTNPPLVHRRLVSSVCTLLWSLTVLAIVHLLPAQHRPHSSEKQVAVGCEQGPLRSDLGKLSPDKPPSRMRNTSLSRRESDSLLDFLSLRDPFASSPPPPPPLPPVALGLEEVDVGWNGGREISTQYRFPAPRSIVNGARRKGRKDRANRSKHLAHQDSARTLLATPETRAAKLDGDRDKVFGDEARLTQLLLQSLSESNEACNNPNAAITPVPIVHPQMTHVQQTSRWSASTTVQSVTSGSVSNRSGMSTYTTCGSEKVPTSRISLNTIASALGSRKSSEAKRKSATTASSSKG